MSRRESRSSVGRQTDTLQEFENLKRKYLLANKHITKLNSQLHVRIEELNVQVTTLSAENLQLRATQLSLSARIAREKERSRKIACDAETAVEAMMRQLQTLRSAFGSFSRPSMDGLSPSEAPAASSSKPLPIPRAQKPPRPSTTRLSKAPGFAEIDEASEESCSTPSRPLSITSPSLHHPPLSLALLPSRTAHIPMRDVSPPDGVISHSASASDSELTIKRRPTRRQSGLLTPMPMIPAATSLPTPMSIPRLPSPAPGSPAVAAAAGGGSDDEVDNLLGTPTEQDIDRLNLLGVALPKVQFVEPPSKPPKEKLGRDEALRLVARDERLAEKERQRQLEKERVQMENEREAEAEKERKAKAKAERERRRQVERAKSLRDVTNSPPMRFMSPADPAEGEPPQAGIDEMMEDAGAMSVSEQLDNDATREKRTRKSVNYAEPKLNTKMRKPEGTPAPKPRTSTTKRKRPPVSSSSLSAKLSSFASGSGLPSYASGSDVDDETEEGGFEADGESPKRAAARASGGGATKRRRASVDVGGTSSGLDPPRLSGSSIPRSSISTSRRSSGSPREGDFGPMIADPRTSSPSRKSPASVPLPPDMAEDFSSLPGLNGMPMGMEMQMPMFSADGKPVFADGRPMFVEGKKKRSMAPAAALGAEGDADVYTADGRRHSIAF